MTVHIEPIFFHAPGLLALALSNVLSFFCLQDNFSKDDKAGLGSVLLFIPVTAITILSALLLIGFHHNIGWAFIMPALVVLDALRKISS